MAARPWETRLMDATDAATPPTKHLKSPEVVKVRRNNVTTRVSAKPPPDMSSSSSGYDFNVSPGSTTPASVTTGLVSDNSSKNKPSYMSMTESTKAKRRTNHVMRQSMDEFQFMNNSGLFTGDLKSSSPVSSDPPSYVTNFSKPFGVSTRRG